MQSLSWRGGRMWFAMLLALTAHLLLAEAGLAAQDPTVIVLEPYIDQEHFIFYGSINGQQGRFQFDSGGGLTVLTPQAAAIQGCRAWGQVTGFRMRGDRLDLARCDGVSIDLNGAKLQLPIAGVWDLSSVLPKDAPALLGSVGLDAFSDRAITIDLSGHQLVLETPSSLKDRMEQGTEVPIHLVSEAEGYSQTIMAGVDTSAGMIWLDLDSGNDTGITIGRHVAALLGLDPQKQEGQPLSTILAGGVPLQGKAYVRDLIYDGNIGVPILKHWVVTIDLASRRMWIAPKPSRCLIAYSG